MKKLLFILIMAIFMLSCEQPISNDYEEKIVDNTINNESIEEEKPTEPEIIFPPIGDSSILFAFYRNNTLSFYDGTNFTTAYTGKINYSGNRILSIDDVLHYMDYEGKTYKSYRLAQSPDNILVIQSPSNSRSINPDDVWELITISAQESASLGAMGRIHTKILKNGVEVGLWYNNPWEIKKTHKVATGEIIAETTLGHLHNINGSTVPFKIYGELYISDINYSNKMAHMHTSSGSEWITYRTNHFINGLWQEANGTWYSSRGATYKYGEGLTEGSTDLFNFAGAKDLSNEYYNFCPAGKRVENSEEVTFWINSTTGDLYKHIPSIDRFEKIKKIYNGSNSFVTGRNEFSGVKPEWINDKLYFNYEGSLNAYDPTTGAVNIISDSGEVFVW